MRYRIKWMLVLGATVVLGTGLAHGDVFKMSDGQTSLEFVPVGNPCNMPDTTGYGAVDSSYNIGKYEVTAGQYAEFLNNKAKCDSDPYGLYNTNMTGTYGCNIQRVGGGTVANPYTYSVAPDWANRPVNYVSLWDSLRFANWLHNGQGSSSTETGAYTMGSLGLVGVPTSPPVTHTVGAIYWLPTENEWYKAAYYKGGGTDSGYWGYTTQSNDFPSNTGSDGYTDPGNSANSAGVAPYYRTKVGEFENSASAYGTFDQGGNVGEWNEAIADQESGITFRGLRGGSFNYPDSIRNAPIGNDYDYIDPNEERSDVGFRVASVPEPGSVTLLVCGATGGLICYWRRRLR